MKVLIVTPGSLPVPAVNGGAVESIIDNIIKLNENAHKMDIVVASIYDKKCNFKNKHCEYFYVKDNILISFLDKIVYFFAKNILRKQRTMSYRYILKRVRFLRKVGKYMHKNTFDKVVLENNFSEYICIKYRHNREKYLGKIYYHTHNAPSVYSKFLKEIETTNTILGVSDFSTNLCKSTFPSMKNIHYVTLKNAVDQSIFRKIDDKDKITTWKKKYNVPLDKRIVLFAGRMTYDKGIDKLLDAFKSVSDDCHLLLVGNFFFGTNIKNKETICISNKLKLIEGKYSFTGFVPYSQMYEVYNIADISVVPSVWEEPGALTIVESLSCGKPLITTKAGGIPEYANERCAIFVDRDENMINNLSKKINLIINDKEKLNTMSLESLRASQNLNLERYFDEFVAILNDKM